MPLNLRAAASALCSTKLEVAASNEDCAHEQPQQQEADIVTTHDAVIMMPGIVVRHPSTSITEEGHKTYIRSVRPTMRTPATPNQRFAART